jgi:hypothetical protein
MAQKEVEALTLRQEMNESRQWQDYDFCQAREDRDDVNKGNKGVQLKFADEKTSQLCQM